MLVCPPRSCCKRQPYRSGDRFPWGDRERRTQTLKFRFLYVTDSTLKPIVGIVVTTSPICTACQQVSLRLGVEAKRVSYFESVKQGCLASVVLEQSISKENSASGTCTPYQAQDQYPNFLLCPQEAGKP